MARALQKYCGDITPIGPLKPFGQLVGKAVNKAVNYLTGRRYLYSHTKSLSGQFARLIEPKILGKNFDIIFGSAASTELAYLHTDVPVVYTSDSTVALMIDYNPSFSRVLNSSLRAADAIERRAIEKASLVLYSSTWAAQSAVNHYHASSAKVRVIPFGANLDEYPDAVAVLKKAPSRECHLLFIGVDWDNKGGPIAYEALLGLEKLGIPASLTVVGCVPPKQFHHQEMRVVPYIDKNDAKGRALLSELYSAADFFLLPTRTECYGIAFCEACAFGLPVIATDTGGVSEIVKNNSNGFLLHESARGADYAKVISDVYSDPARYMDLRKSCREQFEMRLNWDAWGTQVARFVSELV